MAAQNTSKKRDMVVVSQDIGPDTLIETVYDADRNTTKFVVAKGSAVQIASHWDIETGRLHPIGADHNLIKHQAVLLSSEPVDFGIVDQLTSEIAAYISSYVSLSSSQIQVVTAFVLLSWVYDAFNELPYLRFRGDYGTGKTRALIVIGALCYKVFFASGASTVAPIFHTLDLFQGTLVLDEADFRFTDEKAELVKILNNGNARGFPVLRMQINAKKEFDPRAFQVFGPKIVGMRSSYADRALESRFVTVDMLPREIGGVPLNLPDQQRDRALGLRNKLLMYRLRCRHLIALDPSLADDGLEPRSNQILLPLLSVAPTPEMRDAIRASASMTYAVVLEDRRNTLEGRTLAALRGLKSGGAPIRVADVAAEVTKSDAESDRAITNRTIGKSLRRMGVALYKRNGVTVIVPGQTKRLAALYRRYGLNNADPE